MGTTEETFKKLIAEVLKKNLRITINQAFPDSGWIVGDREVEATLLFDGEVIDKGSYTVPHIDTPGRH